MISLPCICLSCASALIVHGHTRSRPGEAVACDCKDARDERKAAGTYNLGWIFKCTECNHFKDAHADILTFDYQQLLKVINGTKTATTRGRVHGKVGSRFYCAGEEYQITAIYPITQDVDLDELSRKEGYDGTPDFIRDICEVYYPDDAETLYVHEFAKVI